MLKQQLTPCHFMSKWHKVAGFFLIVEKIKSQENQDVNSAPQYLKSKRIYDFDSADRLAINRQKKRLQKI
jgi:hypothetical protein